MTVESESTDIETRQTVDESSMLAESSAAESQTTESDESNEQALTSEMLAEFEAMKSMGLPTVFGSQVKPKSKSKRKKSANAGEVVKKSPKKQKVTKSDDTVKSFKMRRRLLFSKWPQFTSDIVIDDHMYYSITPEEIATTIAIHCREKASYTLLLDGFCGVGGNLIQFAVQNPNAFIVGIDNTFERIQSAKKIAKLYGVEHRCDFICGDFFAVAPSLQIKPDVVFLSPPWGGSKFKNQKKFRLSDLPVDGHEIFRISKQLTNNIAFYLPRNQDLNELDRLNVPYSVYKHVIDWFGATLSVFFGDLIDYELSPARPKPPIRYPPAIRFADELNLDSTRSDSSDAGSSSANCNNQPVDLGGTTNDGSPSCSRPNETSPIDSELNDAAKTSEHANDDRNCSGTRLGDSNNNVLNSNQTKKNKSSIFQKAKRMRIAEVLKERKCCLM